ncbi:P-loop containing nucleoside triphosphate hydrolase protein [Flagelloscypha sp. PMI_526]|nr:P-loop containing nucleoside triphosphate hydrolase protein [Flagelloscypha sp. PMI_526]
MGLGTKRKLESSSSSSFTKSKRVKLGTTNRWKPVKMPSNVKGDWEGLLQVEELDMADLENSSSSQDDNEEASQDDDNSLISANETEEEMDPQEADEEIPFDPTNLPDWPSFLHPKLLRSLHSRGFTTMTPIQKSVITESLCSSTEQDVIGLAETGSGKTLAFSLPILHTLLSFPSRENMVRTLIVTPTRELANQIRDHLSLASASALSITSLTGGMSIQKQRRVLSSPPSIVIGTPGRVSELLDQGTLFLGELDNIVFDEFDKLFFAKGQGWRNELDNIARAIRVLEQPDSEAPRRIRLLPVLFRIHSLSTNSLLQDVSLYIFYLLHSAYGNSTDAVFRPSYFSRLMTESDVLYLVLTLLQVQVCPLHSGMDQKARLKSLDRFRSRSGSILLTTDLSSRGLDLPSIRNVIHFNVPPSGEVYVHRIGRTSRGEGKKGFSCVFVSPEERSIWKGVLSSLNKTQPEVFPMPASLIKQAKPRIVLAKKVDKMANRARKISHEKKWEREAREALGAESASSSDEEDSASTKKKQRDQLTSLKSQLSSLLSRRLTMPGVVNSFVTSGVRPLVSSSSVDGMIVGLGQGEENARNKVLVRGEKTKKVKKKAKKAVEVENVIKVEDIETEAQ